jgi:CIC family chloride channel protein
LLISSVTAALTSYLFLGQDTVYTFTLTENFKLVDTPFYILLGLFAGLVSVYFTRIYLFVTTAFEKIKMWYNKLIIGGFILGLLIFLVPSLYGEGYEGMVLIMP